MRKRIVTHSRARNGARAHKQRGIAMLLVLISLMMATVLTTSYVASRDNSAAIGQNAAAAAAARWAAESGMDFGIAVLETQTDWRAGHASGRLLSDYPLAGSTIDLDLIDIVTGMPPSSTTEHVRMTVTANVAGVNQTAVADCYVPQSSDPTIDVDLSEFALFASARLELSGKATIARWPTAPLSALGERIMIGTRATGSASIDLAGQAAAVDATVYVGPGASASLVAVASGAAPVKVSMLDFISLPASPAPGVSAPSGGSADLAQMGGTAITNASMRWGKVELKSGALRTLRGNITVVADDDFCISGSSKLIVEGNVKMVVFGDLQLDSGAIELKNGASLTIFVGGDAGNTFEVRDGYVGNLRANSVRDFSGGAAYMDPERVDIFSMPTSSPGNWKIEKNSVVKGSIYAPDADRVELKEQTAVYGRIAGRHVRISEDAAVFYDPGLNCRGGYSVLNGPLYQVDGRLKPEFRNIPSLDAGVLQGLADTLGIIIRSVLGLLFRPASHTPTTPVVGPTDPTPRTIEVEYQVVSIGDSLASWE